MDRFIPARAAYCPAMPAPRLDSARLKALRLLQVSMSFVVLYGASNYLTGLRGDIGSGVFAWERAIPFVEISILPYLSIFVLFIASFFACRGGEELERHCARLLLALLISVVCYTAFPLRFEFVRPDPIGATGAVFRWLWAIDLPFNRAPSLHISVLVILWARFLDALPARSRPLLHAWMIAIAVSVLTTYQHHVVDVASGMLVGAVCLAMPSVWLRRMSELGGERRFRAGGFDVDREAAAKRRHGELTRTAPRHVAAIALDTLRVQTLPPRGQPAVGIPFKRKDGPRGAVAGNGLGPDRPAPASR